IVAGLGGLGDRAGAGLRARDAGVRRGLAPDAGAGVLAIGHRASRAAQRAEPGIAELVVGGAVAIVVLGVAGLGHRPDGAVADGLPVGAGARADLAGALAAVAEQVAAAGERIAGSAGDAVVG